MRPPLLRIIIASWILNGTSISRIRETISNFVCASNLYHIMNVLTNCTLQSVEATMFRKHFGPLRSAITRISIPRLRILRDSTDCPSALLLHHGELWRRRESSAPRGHGMVEAAGAEVPKGRDPAVIRFIARQGRAKNGGGGGNRTRVRSRIHERPYVRSRMFFSRPLARQSASSREDQLLFLTVASERNERPARLNGGRISPNGRRKSDRRYLIKQREPTGRWRLVFFPVY